MFTHLSVGPRDSNKLASARLNKVASLFLVSLFRYKIIRFIKFGINQVCKLKKSFFVLTLGQRHLRSMYENAYFPSWTLFISIANFAIIHQTSSLINYIPLAGKYSLSAANVFLRLCSDSCSFRYVTLHLRSSLYIDVALFFFSIMSIFSSSPTTTPLQ